MKKIKKIKIKVNGKFKSVPENYKISDLVKDLKIPLKKVAIELNQEIMDKKKISKIVLKKDDKILDPHLSSFSRREHLVVVLTSAVETTTFVPAIAHF